jgi:four helix bundle protein
VAKTLAQRDSSFCQRPEAASRGFARFALLRGACGALDPASGLRRDGWAAFGRKAEHVMLRIYPVTLDWLEKLVPLIAQIGRHDRDLQRQLRRSSTSVVLNLGEGMYARVGNRTNSYAVSLREMRESYSALEIAVRLGYIKPLTADFDDLCHRIIGTLVRLALPTRR